MKLIRLILDDAPESLPVSLEMHYHKGEVIIWPLDNDQAEGSIAEVEIGQAIQHHE